MKLSESPPKYCAACHGQYPDRRHVDFEAYYDGPTIKEGEKDNTIQVSIDDLIICDTCMKVAAELLGYVEDSDSRKQIDEYVEKFDEMHDEIQALRKDKKDLLYTINHVVHRPAKVEGGGKPKILHDVIEEAEKQVRENAEVL